MRRVTGSEIAEVPTAQQQVAGTVAQLLVGDAPEAEQRLPRSYRLVAEIRTAQREELTARARLEVVGW